MKYGGQQGFAPARAVRPAGLLYSDAMASTAAAAVPAPSAFKRIFAWPRVRFRRGALRWLRASAGNTVRLIAVDDVDFLRSVSHVTRGENETADIHLKGRGETLPVSRTYLHLFRQM